MNGDNALEMAHHTLAGSWRAAHQALFSVTQEPVFLVSQSGTIVDVNPAALALLGYAQDELVGSPMRSLCLPSSSWERIKNEADLKGASGDEPICLRSQAGGGSIFASTPACWNCRWGANPTTRSSLLSSTASAPPPSWLISTSG